MKKHLDHFKHPISSIEDPRFIYLRAKYGWAGEGRYYALKCLIAESPNCELDLVSGSMLPSISVMLGLSLDEFRGFINFLVDDTQLLVIVRSGVYSTKDLLVQYGQVSTIRSRWRQNKQKEKQVFDAIVKKQRFLARR